MNRQWTEVWMGLASICILASQSVQADQMKVTLFGQPCSLKGPQDISILTAVHAISPEQIYPPFEPGETSAKVKKAIEQLKTSKPTPTALENYRDQLSKRLDAEINFLNGIDTAQKSHQSTALISDTKKFIAPSRQKDFETLAKKLETNISAQQRSETVQLLFRNYNDAMPSDPEEEFHRAIQRLKIQYDCAFEETDTGEKVNPEENTGTLEKK